MHFQLEPACLLSVMMPSTKCRSKVITQAHSALVLPTGCFWYSFYFPCSSSWSLHACSVSLLSTRCQKQNDPSTSWALCLPAGYAYMRTRKYAQCLMLSLAGSNNASTQTCNRARNARPGSGMKPCALPAGVQQDYSAGQGLLLF